jgi:hypothetical protein
MNTKVIFQSLFNAVFVIAFAPKSYNSRELSTQADHGVSTSVDVVVPPHGCVLLELKP